MHKKLGIGHYDIKLENILIGNDYRPKLCDMGTAQNLSLQQTHKVGTKNYMAPEVRVATEKGFRGCKPDIFALGVLLFAMHFGFPPWEETSERDRYFRAYKCKAHYLFKYRSHTRKLMAAGKINKDLMSLILSLLAYNTYDRPDSIDEVLHHPFFENVEDIEQAEAAKRIKNLLRADFVTY